MNKQQENRLPEEKTAKTEKRAFFTSRNIAWFAILLALTIVLQIWGSAIKIGGVSLNLSLIPIVLAAISIAVVMLINDSPYWLNDPQLLVILVFTMLASLNSFLAIFNLLPIGPLDGGKILAWNKVVWGLMFVIAIVEIACVYLVFEISYIPYVNPLL